jgi:hypothetical protein
MTKQFGIAVLILVAIALAGCGSANNTNGTINGNWTAALSDQSGTPVFAFTTSLTQNNGTAVTVTNLNFTTATPCFASGSMATGAFVLSGNFNGSVTGSFQLTVQSANPSGNMLTLQGTVKNNVITGTWSLTGVTSGCTGSGNFTMNKM